jgi:hypothetical protein
MEGVGLAWPSCSRAAGRQVSGGAAVVLPGARGSRERGCRRGHSVGCSPSYAKGEHRVNTGRMLLSAAKRAISHRFTAVSAISR